MFHEANPLDLEWFGGIDSSVPLNDLPPFAAVTAQNCVFPKSGVASRPGFTSFASSPYATAHAANSIFVLTTRKGSALKRLGFVGNENGVGTTFDLDNAYATSDFGPKINATPVIILGTQYYQRAMLTWAGPTGYGEYAQLFGTTFYGITRFATPPAPTLTALVGSGACTSGVHKVALSVSFDDGSDGPLGEPASVTVASGGRIQIDWTAGHIPTTPEVTGIHIWITTAGDNGNFFRIATVAPTANTYTTAFADETIATYSLASYQSRLRSPKFPALAVEYGGRLAYFGEKHRAVAGWDQGGSQQTDFGVGAFIAASVAPAGWTVASGSGYGLLGNVAAITFDGVTTGMARLVNKGTLVNDLPAIASKVASGWTGTFGLRIIYQKADDLVNASLKWGITGTTGSTDETIVLGGLDGSTVYVSERVVTGTFSDDCKLFFEGIGPGVNNNAVYIIAIEAFDPTNTSHKSTVWWSLPFQARAIDGLYGAQTYGTADSTTAWLGFEWQGRFFVAKDSSLWVTQKTDEDPINWPTEKISDLVGACGRRAVGHGPNFKILVNRSGCWLFQGTAVGPEGNLANEIPTEWESINWDKGHLIWIEIDELEERVHIGVPTGSSAYCDKQYVLDYSGGFGAGTEAGGRRWSVWPIESRGACVGRRAGAATAELWIPRTSGSYVSLGYLDPTATTDWGSAAIPWIYESGKIGAPDGSLGLFRRLTFNAEGSGLLVPSLVKSDGLLVTLPSPTLYTPMRGTQHLLTQVTDERVGIRLETSGTGARVHVHRLSLWMRRHPFGSYRARTP